MKLESRFDVGDTIYQPLYRHERTWVTCPDCLGECHWECKLPTGEELRIQCPTCESYGHRPPGRVEEWGHVARVEEHVVAKVRFEDDRFQYLCEIEGRDNSWSIVDRTEAYATREEAEAALPAMMDQAEARLRREIECEESRRADRRKRAGSMLSFHRRNKRRALKDLRAAEDGIARETGKEPAHA